MPSNVTYTLTYDPVTEDENGVVYKVSEKMGKWKEEGYMILTNKKYVEVELGE